jgi:hypothetical protein
LLITCTDTSIRRIDEGKDYAERAFINKSSPIRTIISAGVSLSEAYNILGEYKNAYNCMNKTISLARLQNAPKEFLDGLAKKLEGYKK